MAPHTRRRRESPSARNFSAKAAPNTSTSVLPPGGFPALTHTPCTRNPLSRRTRHSTLCPLRTPRPHAARQIDKQSEKKKKQRQHGKVECRKQAALGSTGRDDGSGGAVEKKREHHGQKAHPYLPTSSIAAYSIFFDNMRFMVEGELARLMARLLRSEPRD